MAIRVLIVDDSSVMRAMILKTMRMSGLPLGEVFQAGNGQEGLAVLEENQIDLVMVDINMPVMNGEEMVERMMQNSHMSSIPKLVVSTEGSESRIARLREMGTHFIHKPFTPEMILAAVQDMLEMGGDNDNSTE
jgi:two-component system, chemotaxis family, chemotaxis protein CheY